MVKCHMISQDFSGQSNYPFFQIYIKQALPKEVEEKCQHRDQKQNPLEYVIQMNSLKPQRKVQNLRS